MKICSQCGSQQQLHARFCTHCGKSLQTGYRHKFNINSPAKKPNYVPYVAFSLIAVIGLAVFVTFIAKTIKHEKKAQITQTQQEPSVSGSNNQVQGDKKDEKLSQEEYKEIQKIGRKAVVIRLEEDFLSKGYDFYFTLEGDDEETLRIKYVLMSRPIVYQIVKETDFLTTLQSYGFQKVIFTDGYNESWTYNL